MAEQPQNQSSDEIDLGQLFQLIGRGFNQLGLGFLKLFLYLKKRALIIGGLAILGVVVGYGLNQITEKKKKIEVIVKPNLDSENYLYDVVAEIQSNIKSKDTTFFNDLGIRNMDLAQFKISVNPIEQDKSKKVDIDYLELLEKFQNNAQFSDVIRAEITKQSALNHRIEFLFNDAEEGQNFADKVMMYINSSDYFKELIDISNSNSETRLKENELLIQQIDSLIVGYTQSLGKNNSVISDAKLLLNNDEPLDITGLLQLKNGLIRNSAQQRLDLQKGKNIINVLNFGKPQQVVKSFFRKRLISIPMVLVLLFFLWEIGAYLNRKAKYLIVEKQDSK
ncbi:MAG: hypothetical protein AAFU57_17525 [Bacteroidota bacterium]